MINLTPISENIQKRLFEKMSVLGREQVAINNTVTTSSNNSSNNSINTSSITC